MDLQLTGRVALVTGASQGIGLAIARTLAAEGARVVVASRTPSAELAALGGDVLHVPSDFMVASAPALAVARTLERYGSLDILVNNAGGPPPGVALPHSGFLGRDDADWQAMFDFNLFSAVRASRAALPYMLEQGAGTIVNVSSVNGRQPASMNVDYSAAKAAMISVTKALSAEFSPRGVRVNGVCPGPVRTPWWTEPGGVGDVLAAQSGTSRAEALDTLAPEMLQMTTGRLIEPQEVADVVALLASPRSASTTGVEYAVDGGYLKAT